MQSNRNSNSLNNPFRPIYIMVEDGVDQTHVDAVIKSIHAVTQIAGVNNALQINNFGVWRSHNWLNSQDQMTEWNSVDWYIEQAQVHGRHKQLHGGHLMKLLWNEPWQKMHAHYDIVITKQDLYDEKCNFVIGLAVHRFGTIISTNRFLNLESEVARECIVTEAMHEIGHMFGLILSTRTQCVDESLGLHCTNKCIMRQGLSVPHDWLVFTEDRLNGFSFCDLCTRDLKRYFSK